MPEGKSPLKALAFIKISQIKERSPVLTESKREMVVKVVFYFVYDSNGGLGIKI